jgi:hypothetical protein
MANSIIFKSPGTSSDTSLPLVKKDALINAGSLFLIDFLRLGCWNPATDVVANSAPVRNLVAGAPAASLQIPVAGDLTFVAGLGMQLRATVALGRLQIGAANAYFQGASVGQDLLMTAWVTYPAVDPGGHIGRLIEHGTLASYASEGPSLAARYVSGGDINGRMDSSVGNASTVANVGAANGKHQFAVAKVGTNCLLYRDGVLKATIALGTPVLAANANPLSFGNGPVAGQYAVPGAILHRVYGENLTLSGQTAGTQVALDYAQNSARFV